MKKRLSNRVVLSGMLVAVGLILPFVTAHAFGVPGTILLPMHIPVFLIGLLCGPQYGAIGGVVIPVLSSLLTGMPPVFPVLPAMAGELFAYGLISGLLYKKLRLPIYPSLLLAMVSGRVINGLIFAALLFASNGTLAGFSVMSSFIQGLPGVVIQLILIPAIVMAIKKFDVLEDYENIAKTKPVADVSFSEMSVTDVASEDITADDISPNGISAAGDVFAEEVLKQAKQMIKEEKASCVIIKDNAIVYTDLGPGVKPLISLYENHPEILKDAFVVDKVIGKAAAMMAVLGGATKVYGLLMSKSAQIYLGEQHIDADCERWVDVISNRKGDGLCPLEKSVLNEDNAEAAYLILKDTIRKLMSAV